MEQAKIALRLGYRREDFKRGGVEAQFAERSACPVPGACSPDTAAGESRRVRPAVVDAARRASVAHVVGGLDIVSQRSVELLDGLSYGQGHVVVPLHGRCPLPVISSSHSASRTKRTSSASSASASRYANRQPEAETGSPTASHLRAPHGTARKTPAPTCPQAQHGS